MVLSIIFGILKGIGILFLVLLFLVLELYWPSCLYRCVTVYPVRVLMSRSRGAGFFMKERQGFPG